MHTGLIISTANLHTCRQFGILGYENDVTAYLFHSGIAPLLMSFHVLLKIIFHMKVVFILRCVSI